MWHTIDSVWRQEQLLSHQKPLDQHFFSYHLRMLLIQTEVWIMKYTDNNKSFKEWNYFDSILFGSVLDFPSQFILFSLFLFQNIRFRTCLVQIYSFIDVLILKPVSIALIVITLSRIRSHSICIWTKPLLSLFCSKMYNWKSDLELHSNESFGQC